MNTGHPERFRVSHSYHEKRGSNKMANTLYGTRVEESTVRGIRQPEFTHSFHPWNHDAIISSLERGFAKQTEFEILRREYSLNGDGAKMFGVWHLNRIGSTDTEKNPALGFRNAIDKSFRYGVCGGQNIIVCGNMQMDGTYLLDRKHTGGLDEEELEEMADKAMAKMSELFTSFEEFQNRLKETKLSEELYNKLMIESLRRSIVNPIRFGKADKIIRETPRYHETVDGWRDGMTELWNKRNLFVIQQKNTAMNGMLREQFPATVLN